MRERPWRGPVGTMKNIQICSKYTWSDNHWGPLQSFHAQAHLKQTQMLRHVWSPHKSCSLQEHKHAVSNTCRTALMPCSHLKTYVQSANCGQHICKTVHEDAPRTAATMQLLTTDFNQRSTNLRTRQITTSIRKYMKNHDRMLA